MNCSNCKHSRIRRTDVWCSKDQSMKSLLFCCVDYEQGIQAEILSSEGKVIFPIKS